MKTKLLTICLLLVTSQVFAKEYNLYNCKVHGNESKSYVKYYSFVTEVCKPLKTKLKIKVNERNDKVLLIFSENSKEVNRTFYN